MLPKMAGATPSLTGNVVLERGARGQQGRAQQEMRVTNFTILTISTRWATLCDKLIWWENTWLKIGTLVNGQLVILAMISIILAVLLIVIKIILKIETVGEPGSGDRLRHFSESAVGNLGFFVVVFYRDWLKMQYQNVSVINSFPNGKISQQRMFFTKYWLGGGKRRRATFSTELRQLRRRWFTL